VRTFSIAYIQNLRNRTYRPASVRLGFYRPEVFVDVNARDVRPTKTGVTAKISAFSLTFATFFCPKKIANQLRCSRLTILTGYFFTAKKKSRYSLA
jgi:hypothetical protein